MTRITNDYIFPLIKDSGRFVVQEDGTAYRRLADKSLKKVGYAVSDGRVQLKVFGKTVYLSRLVWFWFNGVIPAGFEVDHKNDDRTDNRLENLQLLNRHQNQTKQHTRFGVPSAKLNKTVVSEMRADYTAGLEPVVIARKYKMSESHTRAILRGDFWKGVV